MAAGNTDVQGVVRAILEAGGKVVFTAANVLPRIGVLDPHPAREAIRDVFIRHVIGGKGLSTRGTEFADLVRAATPDAVLAGVELLVDGAEGVPGTGDVLVVDVGGATTDVYSVVTPDAEEAALRREVVEVLWRSRTVEGDLGVRWTAAGVVAAAVAERLLSPAEATALEPATEVRTADPGFTAASDDDVDAKLATLAATIAVRRHARPHESSGDGGVRHGGRDLRDVGLVVGSGGVLRHAEPAAALRLLTAVVADTGGGWQVPEHPRLVIDRSYVLAAAGLLALSGHRRVGAQLLRNHLLC